MFGCLNAPECVITKLLLFIIFISDKSDFEEFLLDMEKCGVSVILFDLDNTLVDTAGAGQLAVDKVRVRETAGTEPLTLTLNYTRLK